MIYDLIFNELLILKIMDSICELIVFVLALNASLYTYRKYHEKKSKSSLYLMIIFISLAGAPISQFIDGLFYSGWGSDNTFGLYDVQYGYALIIFFTAIVNICLLLFSSEIFMPETDPKKAAKSKMTKSIITSVLGGLGVLGSIMKILNMQVTIIIGIYFVFAMIIYILLGTNAYHLAKKVNDPVYSSSIRYIGHFAFSLLTIYVFFIIDSFSSTYTIWGFFGWAMFLVASYLAYNGFIRPMKISKAVK